MLIFFSRLLPKPHLYAPMYIFFFLVFFSPLTYIIRRYVHEHIYLLLACENNTNKLLLLLSAINTSLVRMYARKNVFFFTASIPHIIYLYTVICVHLDNDWYQNVTHNSLSFYFRIDPCTSIHSAYLLNRFRVMLLQALVRTRVEGLIHEIFLCLGPTSDGMNDGQPTCSVPGGSSPSTFWGGVNVFAKPLITARRLLDRGHSSKREGCATPQDTSIGRPKYSQHSLHPNIMFTFLPYAPVDRVSCLFPRG